jgi:uncharacterized delta-60 repeat protein
MRRAVIVSLAALCACNLITGAAELTIAEDCAECPPEVLLPDREEVPDATFDAPDVIDPDAEPPGGIQDRPFGGAAGGVAETTLLTSPVGVGVLSDGKFVVVGTQASSIVMVRFDPDGTVDTSFGDQGLLTVPPLSDETLIANAVAIDAQDRAVVAGSYDQFIDDGTGMGTGTRYHNHYVIRVTRAGALDPTFAGNGRYRGLSNNEDAFAVAAGPGGSVLLAGRRLTNTGAVWKVTAVGAPDGTFNNIFGRGALSPSGPGRAVVATPAGVFAAFAINSDFGAGRLTEAGAADVAFGADGLVVTPVGESTDTPVAAAQTKGGKTVVVGEVVAESPVFIRTPQFGVARYDAVRLDETFGQGGTVVEDFDPQTPFQSASDVPRAVVLDERGRIVVVGHARERADNVDRYRVVAMRLLDDGSLDPLFGAGGKMTFTDANRTFQVRAAAPQPDGKIVVVGTNGSACLLARIIP